MSSVYVAWENKDDSRHHWWFPCEMTFEKRAQKFLTDDAQLVDLSRACDWLEICFPILADLVSDASSVWNSCARSSDVISREYQWWRGTMSAVSTGYSIWPFLKFFTLKANLIIQEARLQKATSELNEAQAQLDEKQRELDLVQAKYDQAMRDKQTLVDDAEACRRKMANATALIDGLGGEKTRWTEQSKKFDQQIQRFESFLNSDFIRRADILLFSQGAVNIVWFRPGRLRRSLSSWRTLSVWLTNVQYNII